MFGSAANVRVVPLEWTAMIALAPASATSVRPGSASAAYGLLRASSGSAVGTELALPVGVVLELVSQQVGQLDHRTAGSRAQQGGAAALELVRRQLGISPTAMSSRLRRAETPCAPPAKLPSGPAPDGRPRHDGAPDRAVGPRAVDARDASPVGPTQKVCSPEPTHPDGTRRAMTGLGDVELPAAVEADLARVVEPRHQDRVRATRGRAAFAAWSLRHARRVELCRGVGSDEAGTPARRGRRRRRG
jgi:hypothetical protein